MFSLDRILTQRPWSLAHFWTRAKFSSHLRAVFLSVCWFFINLRNHLSSLTISRKRVGWGSIGFCGGVYSVCVLIWYFSRKSIGISSSKQNGCQMLSSEHSEEECPLAQQRRQTKVSRKGQVSWETAFPVHFIHVRQFIVVAKTSNVVKRLQFFEMRCIRPVNAY